VAIVGGGYRHFQNRRRYDASLDHLARRIVVRIELLAIDVDTVDPTLMVKDELLALRMNIPPLPQQGS